jgi:glycosyltransferase involved in cell wall biosynthesis
MPTVSVIIPTFNRENTIVRAISSVLAQSFSDYEILIVDDCSTDGTVQAVEAIGDPRVKLLIREHNGGAPAARNTGIQAADGEYIALLDSDDEWLPEKLQLQLDDLRRTPHCPVSTTACFLDNTSQSCEYHPRLDDNWLRKALLEFDLYIGSTFLGHRSIFDQIGLFDETLRRYEDPDWLIEYCKRYEVAFLDRPLSTIYIGGHKPSPLAQEQAALVLIQKHRADYRIFGRRFEGKCLARMYLEIAWGYYEAGQMDRWKYYFRKTIRCNPTQHPGLYIHYLDSLLGTRIFPWAQKIKRAIVRPA